MAVTGAIFNSLIFGGVDSANYGIYITGEAVYNAPERAVEMVTVPGRNGAIAIDQGRWENIEVEYPAGCFGDGDANFADRISAFRNAVLSQIGYQRLTDTYHPDEYRQAIYVAGLEVEPANINSAGEFKLIFNCKPQRFLTSGETAVAVTSGGTITNPTLCDAKPVIQFNGYGDMTIGSDEIVVENVPVGDLVLADAYNESESGSPGSFVTALDTSMLMSGDDITVDDKKVTVSMVTDYDGKKRNITAFSITSTTNCTATVTRTLNNATITISLPEISFDFGTSSTKTSSVGISFQINEGTTYTNTITITTSLSGSNITHAYTLTNSTPPPAQYTVETKGTAIHGFSTKTISDTFYIDLDIGEVYIISNGTLITLNSKVQLGSELPKLKPGATTITYDNTFTNFKITPRWWQL